jgi:hypothetical protein
MLPDEPFELSVAETAAGYDERGCAGSYGGERSDDVIDILFDVDAGLFLELALPLFMHGERLLEAGTQLGGHDRPNVGVGHERRIGRHVAELVDARRRRNRRESAGVIANQPRSQPCRQDRRRTCHEVTGFPGHALGPPVVNYTGREGKKFREYPS